MTQIISAPDTCNQDSSWGKKNRRTRRRFIWLQRLSIASNPLEDNRNTLTATDTHGDETVFTADTIHFVNRLGSNEGT